MTLTVSLDVHAIVGPSTLSQSTPQILCSLKNDTYCSCKQNGDIGKSIVTGALSLVVLESCTYSLVCPQLILHFLS